MSSAHPTPAEARDALASADRASQAGFRRGVYPRWLAAVLAVWAGALAVTVGHVVWFLVFGAGLLIHWHWRRRNGAWMREIQSARDLWIVLPAALVVGGLYLGAYLARVNGVTWVPYAAGLAIAIGLFAITEWVYGARRIGTARSRPS